MNSMTGGSVAILTTTRPSVSWHVHVTNKFTDIQRKSSIIIIIIILIYRKSSEKFIKNQRKKHGCKLSEVCIRGSVCFCFFTVSWLFIATNLPENLITVVCVFFFSGSSLLLSVNSWLLSALDALWGYEENVLQQHHRACEAEHSQVRFEVTSVTFFLFLNRT